MCVIYASMPDFCTVSHIAITDCVQTLCTVWLVIAIVIHTYYT